MVDVITAEAVQGCSPGDMDSGRVHELIKTFAVSFLDSICKNGTMIDPTSPTVPDDVVYLVK